MAISSVSPDSSDDRVRSLSNKACSTRCTSIRRIQENNEAGFTERGWAENASGQLLLINTPSTMILECSCHVPVQGDVTALCDISASSKKKPLPGAAGKSIGCRLTEPLRLLSKF